jgi:hypothetical protein
MATENDRAWNEYSQHFRRNVLPKIMSSEVTLSIQAGDGQFDVKQATEVGAAIILGKPIVLLVPKGRTISEKLRLCADVVLDEWELNDPKAFSERLGAAFEQMGIGVNNANNDDQRTS